MKANLTAQATRAARTAAVQNLYNSGNATPVVPISLFRDRRSKVNSSHPANPADAVRPATPHLGDSPIAGGKAKRRGSRVPLSARPARPHIAGEFGCLSSHKRRKSITSRAWRPEALPQSQPVCPRHRLHQPV